MRKFVYPAVLLSLAALMLATETKTWSQSDYPDFEKGSLKNLSLASDGRLMLAPSFQELFDSASVYLWALAEDSKGNIYAGGGGPGGPGARVYMVARNGGGKTLAQLDDLEVHALAVDQKDQVYAATSPDGKVYKLRNGKAEVFFDPKAKYIWGMAFDHHNNLYVATGDRGEIYRVAPDGKGAIFYKTAETHARSLAVDANDNLIVGTEPGGLIIRVSPNGDGFVLYQAARREITAVAVAKDGSIYAAGVGNKAPGIGPAVGPPPSMPPVPQPTPTPVAPVQVSPHPTPTPVAPLGGSALPSIAGGSEVYRIDKDGYPHRVWTHPQNIVYTIAFDPDGRPLVGTGNKGTIYRLDSDIVYTDLLNAPPTQVTAILAGRGGKLYAATGNVGKVYQIGPGLDKEGTLESDVLDAGLFSQWGRLSFRGRPNDGAIEFRTRSGNLDRPQKDWSPWSAALTSAEGGRVASPAARFLQWKLTLRASAAASTPEVTEVDVAYLPRNAAPEVQQIEITPANYKFPATSTLTSTMPSNLSLPPLSRHPASHAAAPVPVAIESTPSMQYAKGWIGARWAASDENGDTLTYTVLIRGEKETEWKLLRDKLKEKYMSWDSSAFPDGEYRLRVVVSDSPSNPAGQALSSELESEPFLIDNTPPQISGLIATPAGNKLTVKWKAADSASVIDKAEYSINGGDWVMVEPTTRLSDSKEEEYSLTLDKPAGAEQTIAVRVSDEYDNQAVAKVVVK